MADVTTALDLESSHLVHPDLEVIAERRRGGQLWRFVRSSPVGTLSAFFLLAIVLLGVLAPLIAPYDPLVADYAQIRRPPSLEHLMGTDHLGRDTLSRVIFGSRVTLMVGVISAVLGDTVGFIWGITSGYLGRRFDLFSQRVLDVLLSFPGIILALLLLAGIGAGLTTVIVAIAVTRVPFATRVVRSIVLSVRELAYIEAARALGASAPRIMLRHVTPQCLAALLVVMSLDLGAAIFAEAALSFLGVGVPPPAPSWGNMLGGILAEAFQPPWWLVLFPGLFITVTIMSTNLLGDALRDYLDPRLNRVVR